MALAALVNGRKVWFASKKELALAPEALGSALLIPAMRARLPLAIDQPVCQTWASNIREIMKTAAGWWGYPILEPRLTGIAATGEARPDAGLCFTGGVDSFYSLLTCPLPIKMLVTAIGYDVKLKETARIAALKQLVREVADERGIGAVFIRTNLRLHPAIKALSWNYAHGGALAALGHLLRYHIGHLIISASWSVEQDIPWGSRWDIDPHYSSADLKIHHWGAELRRTDKLCQIAGEPLVRKHLWVCWENRNAAVNCGVCEKCVRTMLVLASCDQLGSYAQFKFGQGLVEKVDRLRQVSSVLFTVYDRLLERGLPPSQASAVRRLIARSQPGQ